MSTDEGNYNLISREEFLHFLWRYHLYGNAPKRTTEGEELIIVDPGVLNHNSGPDFLNARIRIGDKLWAGHVEFHLKSSDWDRHGHSTDAAYNNVVLHAVLSDDIKRNLPFATWVLAEHVPIRYLGKWKSLMASRDRLPCAGLLRRKPIPYIKDFIYRLGVTRLERKAKSVEGLVKSSVGDWRRAFFLHLSRYFGFKVNNDAFAIWADSIPASVIDKHSDNLFQLEAIFFGQAAFLDGEPKDAYHFKLKQEYAVLQTKFLLKPVNVSIWKFARLMPANFPTLRLAQLAALIKAVPRLDARIIEAGGLEEAERLFSVAVSDYWQHHYHFDNLTMKARGVRLGKQSLQLLIINVLVPYVLAYAKSHAIQSYVDQALEQIERLEPETNQIMRLWATHGITAQNALESQGLIELKTEFCDKKRCLDCAIGKALICAHND